MVKRLQIMVREHTGRIRVRVKLRLWLSGLGLKRFNDITTGVLKSNDGLERIAHLSLIQLFDLKEELFDFASAYKHLAMAPEGKFPKTLINSNSNSNSKTKF